jgi:hypothetical protein
MQKSFCFMRELHSLWSWLKPMRSSVAAVSRLTGIEIRPKLRVPDHTLCGDLSLPPKASCAAVTPPPAVSFLVFFGIANLLIGVAMHNSHSANWVMPTVEGLEQTTLVEPLTLSIIGLQPQELKQLENEIAKSDIASRSAAT